MKDYCYKPYSAYNLKLNYRLYQLKKEIKKEGFKNVFTKYDNLFRNNTLDDCENVACMGFVFDFKHYLRNKHVFNDTLYMPFETITMPVPIGYDDILTTQYGDYMKPAKTSTKHGGFSVLDTEKSYLDYLPILRKQYRKDTWKTRFKLLHQLFKNKYFTE